MPHLVRLERLPSIDVHTQSRLNETIPPRPPRLHLPQMEDVKQKIPKGNSRPVTFAGGVRHDVDRAQRLSTGELLHGDAKLVRECYAGQGEACARSLADPRGAQRDRRCMTDHHPNQHTLRPRATDETMLHGATWQAVAAAAARQTDAVRTTATTRWRSRSAPAPRSGRHAAGSMRGTSCRSTHRRLPAETAPRTPASRAPGSSQG